MEIQRKSVNLKIHQYKLTNLKKRKKIERNRDLGSVVKYDEVYYICN